MRLISLHVEPEGPAGWGTPALDFGKAVTSLFARNGSGKTPLIQMVVFCLGYPTSFRDDINSRCRAAVLTTRIQGELIQFRRTLTKEFRVETIRPNETLAHFSEADFADHLLKMLGVPTPALVGTDRKESQAYLSTLLPLFYVDQDLGYADAYKAPRSFLHDQFVEMIRLAFGLSPKHSYHAKGELLRAKDELASFDRQIVAQQKVTTDLAQRVDARSIEELSMQREQIERRLVALQQTAATKGSANAALEELRAQREQSLLITRQQLSDLKFRVSGIAEIRSEIDAEIATLDLNEESRRVFVSFEEICRNPDCGLFLGSTESYGKNLIYLKDQIKDLERNAQRASVRMEELKSSLARQEDELRQIREKLAAPADQDLTKLVEAIQQLTRLAFEIGQALTTAVLLRTEREKLLKLENRRSRVQDQIANLTASTRSDLEFNALRSRLQTRIPEWLNVLDTKNVSRQVSIDLDFRFSFGADPFTVIKGSTRARVILAIHAALMEEYLSVPERPFRFLILDTPKQQDMFTGDIANYLTAVGELCRERDAQLIFSSTEYRHPLSPPDMEWTPQFPGFEQPMYLGPLNT